MTADGDRVGSYRRPGSYILDLYGSGRRRGLGTWLPVSALVQLMAELDFEGPAVRSALSRMKRRGLLESATREGGPGYELTDEARQILREGDVRIFSQREPANPEDGWILAVFSIPETERSKRHVLRSRLEWLGFGNQAPGVWIAPARLADEAERLIARHGLTPYVHLYRAWPHGPTRLEELVRQSWDLDRLGALYDAYIESQEETAGRWSRVRRIPGRQAFTDYIHALHGWRKFPFLDPGLPAEVLPPRWAGRRATEMFFRLYERLEPPAMEFMGDVLRTRGVTAEAPRRSP